MATWPCSALTLLKLLGWWECSSGNDVAVQLHALSKEPIWKWVQQVRKKVQSQGLTSRQAAHCWALLPSLEPVLVLGKVALPGQMYHHTLTMQKQTASWEREWDMHAQAPDYVVAGSCQTFHADSKILPSDLMGVIIGSISSTRDQLLTTFYPWPGISERFWWNLLYIFQCGAEPVPFKCLCLHWPHLWLLRTAPHCVFLFPELPLSVEHLLVNIWACLRANKNSFNWTLDGMCLCGNLYMPVWIQGFFKLR